MGVSPESEKAKELPQNTTQKEKTTVKPCMVLLGKSQPATVHLLSFNPLISNITLLIFTQIFTHRFRHHNRGGCLAKRGLRAGSDADHQSPQAHARRKLSRTQGTGNVNTVNDFVPVSGETVLRRTSIIAVEHSSAASSSIYCQVQN